LSCYQQDPRARPSSATLLSKFNALSNPISKQTLHSIYTHDFETYTTGLELALSSRSPKGSMDVERNHQHIVKQLRDELDKQQVLLEQEKTRFKKVQAELQHQLCQLRHTRLPKSLSDSDTHTALNSSTQLVQPLQSTGNYFSHVSILVVTIVHFNRMVELFSSTPQLVIRILQAYHEAIDHYLSEHPHIYMVERISDTCIFLSGAPETHTHHEQELADLALYLSHWAANPTIQLESGQKVKIGLKMGLHSGPLIAGIVGRIPKYVVMGDTLNIAARLQSSSDGKLYKID
jgi:class 3 adenylate cyclase